MSKPESSAKPGARVASAARAIEKLADARAQLDAQSALAADSIAYHHAVMCMIGLPRSPQRERIWTRSNGKASLTVIAGGIMRSGVRVEQPLPAGSYPRLIMADIATYAIKHKTTRIPMEASASAYMRNRLHLFVNGGKRGTYTSFKTAALALSAAHVEMSVEHCGKTQYVKAPPIRRFEAWTVDDGEQQALWPCELDLALDFYESLREHAVPVDSRAYLALSHSSMAMDLYSWLAHRLYRLEAPLELPWATLLQQFGGYIDALECRKEIIRRLPEVLAVYPAAKLEIERGRRGQKGGVLRLFPSPPPVPRVHVVVPAIIGADEEKRAPAKPRERPRPRPKSELDPIEQRLAERAVQSAEERVLQSMAERERGLRS